MKPAEKKAKYPYGGMNTGRPVTPPRKQKKKEEGQGAADGDTGVEDDGEQATGAPRSSGEDGETSTPKKTAESELGAQGQGGKDGTPSKRPSAEPAPEDSEPPAQKRTRLQDPDPSWKF